jgi:hypothetical protein
MDFFASGSKPQHPAEWDIWLQLPRPRVVRMQKRQRISITLILTAAIAIATLLLGARFAEWRTHPTRQMMETDILGAVAFLAGGLFRPLIFHFFLKRDRRLLSQGELTIAKIVSVHVGGGHVGLGRADCGYSPVPIDC